MNVITVKCFIALVKQFSGHSIHTHIYLFIYLFIYLRQVSGTFFHFIQDGNILTVFGKILQY